MRIQGNKQLSKETIANIMCCKDKLNYHSIARVLNLPYHTVWRVINISKKK